MPRSLWHRVLSAFVAVWLALVLGEPAVLHACPMHGGAPAAGVLAAAGVPDAAAGHHEHGAPAAPSGGHQCTCLGHCSAPVGVAAPAAAVALVPSADAASTRDRGLPDYEYVPVVAAHVLPFANGPPTTTA